MATITSRGGTVRIVLNAREQFVAFALSSHVRCGSESPARVIFAYGGPLLLRYMWRLMSGFRQTSTHRSEVGSSDLGSGETGFDCWRDGRWWIKFKCRTVARAYEAWAWRWCTAWVSPLLLGVIGDVVVERVEENTQGFTRYGTGGWVDPAHLVGVRLEPDGVFSYLRNCVTGEQKRLFKCGDDTLAQEVAGGKWLVWWGSDGDSDKLVIVDLWDPRPEETRVDFHIAPRGDGSHMEDNAALIANRWVLDRIVILTVPERNVLELREIDLPLTRATNYIVTTGMTRCGPIQEMKSVSKVLFFKNSWGMEANSFIGLITTDNEAQRSTVIKIDSTGQIENLEVGKRLSLSQLNKSLFGVVKSNLKHQRIQFEIWDTNNTKGPWRVIQLNDHQSLTTGADGFIYQIDSNPQWQHRISVIEASSGVVVFTIEHHFLSL